MGSGPPAGPPTVLAVLVVHGAVMLIVLPVAPSPVRSYLGAALPSIAGWGPREGVGAWAFAAAGLGEERAAARSVAGRG